jgi:hypothetical protein
LFFASWDAQTLQKNLALEKFGLREENQHQQAAALLMAVLGLNDQLKKSDLTQKK